MNLIYELKKLCYALTFYTIIPSPIYIDYTKHKLSDVSMYLPIIGWLVGLFSWLVYYVAQLILPQSIAVVLSITSAIIITGGLHEDGLADTCDAFGGGYSKDQILNIMKDSSIGAFGTISLILVILIKYLSLIEVNNIAYTLIAGHSISRYICITFMYTDVYILKANSKCNINSKLSFTRLLLASFFGLIPLILYYDYKVIFILVPMFILRQLAKYIFIRKIGGYTGDLLGAVQQISEVLFYLIMASWTFI